jgi:methylase of polypeptide subunit release factors
MASLQKTYHNEKLFGQVYTPRFIVEKMLDEVGFNSHSVLGRSVLDMACGDGRFLTEVARRIIRFSHKEDLVRNLELIHGWDIDEVAVEQCRKNLDKEIDGIGIRVNWKLSVKNALYELPTDDFFAEPIEQFDVIVGNPPYIRIQHLEENDRKFIQSRYQFCKSGSTDAYIAFFELAFRLLKEQGICAFITPNTFFYTDTAKTLRDFFVEQSALKKLINFGDIQLFENATTYSAITIFSKQPASVFEYQKASQINQFVSKTIATKSLRHEKVWRLSISGEREARGKKLSEVCQIHVGITTLCDKAYIFPIDSNDEKTVLAKTRLKGIVKIEREILKPIVKGSTLKKSSEPIYEYILFPYIKENGKTVIMPESMLQREFPLAYQYLRSVKPELDKRDNGRPNSVAWYAFGRSQSLDTSFGKKIIFSPMNKSPNFILYENEEATIYSGYFIKYSGDMQKLLLQLNSDEMKRFVEASSRDFRGAWKAYSKKVIEDFVVEVD